VEIIYDADTTSYRDLLEIFFQIHDPTTLNRQGNEVGRSVRSAVFYTSEEQRLIALDTIADVDASGLWQGKSLRRWSRRGHSGRLRKTTRITCRSTLTAKRATSFARAGSSLAVHLRLPSRKFVCPAAWALATQ
jgi:hypothetical protein